MRMISPVADCFDSKLTLTLQCVTCKSKWALEFVNYMFKVKDLVKCFDRKPIFMVFCSASVGVFCLLKVNSVFLRALDG